MAKVYVSSTVADLSEERRAVLDWLRLARHQAVDSYLPDSDTVRDSCLEDVAKCDLYVLILGHRYGFQPPDGNLGGLSITHLEFRRAGECGIPRVVLMRTSIPDVRLSDLEDPTRAPLVLAFREEVARQVRPAEFGDLKSLIQGLSTGIQSVIDKLDKRDQRQATQIASARALRLAPRPVFLAGREELLTELDAQLTSNDSARPRLVALCGLGGAGKTSVALEYAHRQLDEVAVAWQFSAENPAVMTAGFGELAAQLGVDRGDPVAAVHAVLAARPTPWLLVFDNAPDRDSVARFVPPAGSGRVLITSRNQIWPPGQSLDVPVLDLEVSGEFLVNRTGDLDRRAAAELAGELGGLPLALEQAAAYVQTSGESMAGYLSVFRQRRADLLDRGEPTGYSQTVAATWRLAFEDLQQAAPGAAGLLRLLAFFAPEAIPLRLLLIPRPGLAEQLRPEVTPVLAPLLEDELVANDAIRALRRYSLISPPSDGSVSVHRLVQAVTVDQMAVELASQWRQAAVALIEDAIPDDTDLPENWPTCAVLLPHAQAALDPTSDGMRQIARYLGYSGAYPAARDLFQVIVDAYMEHDAYGPEHRDTLAACANLARWTGEAGDPIRARGQLTALLPIVERILGPEHPDTITTRSHLASWTGRSGDEAGARDGLTALLPVIERVLGPEHPDTLLTRNNLAYWTGRSGDEAGAREQLTTLLSIRQRVLGPEHPDTLLTWNNLARWTGDAGNAAAARDQLTTLLSIRQRVLGPEHRDTLKTRANLARWTGEAGDAAAARDQLMALLPIRERVLGPEHPDTRYTREDLARWTREANDGLEPGSELAGTGTTHGRRTIPATPVILAVIRNIFLSG